MPEDILNSEGGDILSGSSDILEGSSDLLGEVAPGLIFPSETLYPSEELYPG